MSGSWLCVAGCVLTLKITSTIKEQMLFRADRAANNSVYHINKANRNPGEHSTITGNTLNTITASGAAHSFIASIQSTFICCSKLVVSTSLRETMIQGFSPTPFMCIIAASAKCSRTELFNIKLNRKIILFFFARCSRALVTNTHTL